MSKNEEEAGEVVVFSSRLSSITWEGLLLGETRV